MNGMRGFTPALGFHVPTPLYDRVLATSTRERFARVALIDAEGLLLAFDCGTVAAAGLDALEHEGGAASEAPMGCGGLDCDSGWGTSHPLLRHPRVLATPHVGFNTRKAFARILHETVENIAAWRAGQPRRRLA